MIAGFWSLEGDGNLGRCRGFMSQGRRLLMTRRPSGSAQQRTALAVFVSDFAENTCLCVVAFLSIVSIVFLAFLVLPVFPFYFVAHRLHPFTMSCCSNFSLFAPFALLFFVSSFLFLSSAFPSYPFVVLSSCFICFARCCSFHIFPVLISCSCFNLLTLFTPCIFPHISFFICPLFAKCTTFVPFFHSDPQSVYFHYCFIGTLRHTRHRGKSEIHYLSPQEWCKSWHPIDCSLRSTSVSAHKMHLPTDRSSPLVQTSTRQHALVAAACVVACFAPAESTCVTVGA